MPRAWKTCSVPNCGEVIEKGRKCPEHDRRANKARGTSTQRGYGHKHRKVFRAAVLKRDPTCQCPPDHQVHAGKPCMEWSTVADHWPKSRRDLEAEGLDANAEEHGRGLCGRCHNHRTATTAGQRGGWNNP